MQRRRIEYNPAATTVAGRPARRARVNGVRSNAGYTGPAKAMHWIAALCIVGAWALGELIDDFPKSSERTVLFVHVTCGLSVLALVFLRLGWRVGHRPPPLAPSPLSPWAEWLALFTHAVLYTLMLAVPVAGIVWLFARGQALPLFGLAEIASPWARDRALSRSVGGIHELLANILFFLALFHAAAALFHHYVLRDTTLVRMLPGNRSR